MNAEFLVTSLIVVASPGTGALVTLAAGLSHGTRASLLAALGCTLGIIPHVLVAVTGLAAVLHASAVAFDAIKYGGAAYLLYMAWLTAREDGALRIETDGRALAGRDIVANAVLVNLLNPKLSIFFLAFLPQFVAPTEQQVTVAMLELSAAFMAVTFVVFAFYGVFAARVRDRILTSPGILKWLRRGFAAAFVALSAKLALVRP
jgi:threonine/homoserine/homoserine lactone efflux protein